MITIRLNKRKYPRKTLGIDFSHIRRNATAIVQRARLDRVEIIRCGRLQRHCS